MNAQSHFRSSAAIVVLVLLGASVAFITMLPERNRPMPEILKNLLSPEYINKLSNQ